MFNNGSFVTDPGAGAGGADYSYSFDDQTWGISASRDNGNSIVTDFLVVDQQWTVDSIIVFAYQSYSTTTSTINDVRVQIWSGNPANYGSTVIWGDTTTNRLLTTYWTNTYRGTDFTNTDRPIMAVVCNTTGLVIPQGTEYWVEYSLCGTLASGPWVPPIAAGNDLQNVSGAYLSKNFEYPIEIWGTVTSATCAFVTSVVCSNIETNSFDVAWTSNGTETAWDIEVVAAGGTPTGIPTFNDVTTNPYTVTGLTANTAYNIYVRADCGSSQSLWTNVNCFTTCPILEQCGITLYMTDSYGDGWNGAAVRVVQSGVIKGEFTCTASADTAHLPICHGSSIEIVWIGGSYPSECGLSIEDDATNTILYSFVAGGNPAGGSTVLTFTHVCPGVGFDEEYANGVIFPNPANSAITIQGYGRLSLVEIYNTNGQIVLSSIPDSDTVELQVSELIEGTYIVKITGEIGIFSRNIQIVH